MALCFTLLTAAGLLLRTLLNYEHTNLGMRTEGLLVFGDYAAAGEDNEAKSAFYRTLLERMRAMPEVESATFVDNRMGSGWSSNDEPTVDGVKVSFEQVPIADEQCGAGFSAHLRDSAAGGSRYSRYGYVDIAACSSGE